MSEPVRCGKKMRGIFGALSTCARPPGHLPPHSPIHNSVEWNAWKEAPMTDHGQGYPVRASRTRPSPRTDRVLSHTQYEELRSYEHGNPSWRFYAPASSLTRRGFLSREPGSGYDRRSSAFRITVEGRTALARYREKYGVRA